MNDEIVGAVITVPEEYSQKRDKMVSKAASKLDLNDDQKKRLATLGDKLYEQRTALIGQTKDPHAEMKALVAGATIDKARAQTLVTEKTTALQTKSPEVIAALADFYDSLNPAQQQKVRDYMEGRGPWFRRKETRLRNLACRHKPRSIG